MTQMRAREVRLNLILAIVTTAIGLGLWILGAVALKTNLFLPDYAKTARGVGITALLVGLTWLGLALIKRLHLPPERTTR